MKFLPRFLWHFFRNEKVATDFVAFFLKWKKCHRFLSFCFRARILRRSADQY